jgi:hypothetical protein
MSRVTLQYRYKLICPRIAFIFGPLGFIQLAFGGFCGQFFDSLLQLGRRAKVQDRIQLIGENDQEDGANSSLKCNGFRCRSYDAILIQCFVCELEKCPL